MPSRTSRPTVIADHRHPPISRISGDGIRWTPSIPSLSLVATLSALLLGYVTRPEPYMIYHPFASLLDTALASSRLFLVYFLAEPDFRFLCPRGTAPLDRRQLLPFSAVKRHVPSLQPVY